MIDITTKNKNIIAGYAAKDDLHVACITFMMKTSTENSAERRRKMNKEEVQGISFQIISYAGDAFSYYCQAIESAKAGEFEKADELMELANKQMVEAHRAQTNLLTTEAQGDDIACSVIMVHAQDHLMNAVMFEKVAREFINLYRERK